MSPILDSTGWYRSFSTAGGLIIVMGRWPNAVLSAVSRSQKFLFNGRVRAFSLLLFYFGYDEVHDIRTTAKTFKSPGSRRSSTPQGAFSSLDRKSTRLNSSHQIIS